MTRDRPESSEDVAPIDAAEEAVAKSRKPYKKPEIVRLGSVRDLVLGKSAGLPEGAGTFVKPM